MQELSLRRAALALFAAILIMMRQSESISGSISIQKPNLPLKTAYSILIQSKLEWLHYSNDACASPLCMIPNGICIRGIGIIRCRLFVQPLIFVARASKRRCKCNLHHKIMTASQNDKSRFDFEIGYLIKSPCHACPDRDAFPRCIDRCEAIGAIHRIMANSVSSIRRG